MLSHFLNIPYRLFVIFSFIIPFSAAGALQTGALQGLQEFFLLAKQSVLGAVLKLGIAIGLVLAGFSVVGVIVSLVCAQGAAWLYGFFATRKTLELASQTPHQPIDARPLKLFFSVTLATTFLLAFLPNTDLLLAKHFLPPVLAGEYSGLVILGNIIVYGIGAFTSVLLPMASAAHAAGKGGERRILHLSLGVITTAVVIAWALFSLFPVILVNLLFGSRYLAIAPVLGHYAIAEGCVALSIALINYFVAIRNTTFLYLVGFCIAMEAALIFFNHSSILAIASMFMASSILLLATMSLNYFFTLKLKKV